MSSDIPDASDVADGADATAASTDEPEANDSAVEEAAKHVPSGAPPLRVGGLVKRFGGVTAVDGASFEVEGVADGADRSQRRWQVDHVQLHHRRSRADGGVRLLQGRGRHRARTVPDGRGRLVRTFQIARELSEMTVLENLMLAPKGQIGESAIRSVTPGLRGEVVAQEEEIRERAWETLDFFEIDHLATEHAGNLSGGQRKLLEMARALMTDRPEVVLLDEPLAGVNPTLEEKLLDRIHQLREDGYTFLLVEHDMDVIMNNCEHVIVMHQGSVLAEGTGDEIRNNEQVIEAYWGGRTYERRGGRLRRRKPVDDSVDSDDTRRRRHGRH